MFKQFAVGALLTLSAAFASAHARTCAVVYQGPHFTGHSMVVRDGAHIRSLARYNMNYQESWNNRISSLVVHHGCQLVGYQYDNFGRHYQTGERIGDREKFYGPGYYEYMGYTNDLVSSLTCNCR